MTGFCGGGDSDDDGCDSFRLKIERLKRERDEARSQLENVLDSHAEGGWQARALDAERNVKELVDGLLPFTDGGIEGYHLDSGAIEKARALVGKYGPTRTTPAPDNEP